MRILNLSQNTMVAAQAQSADSFLSRLIGLLNRQTLLAEQALVISDCRAIHMWFMRFAIDVIFVDRQGQVLRLVKGIAPFQMSPYVFKAYYAIEGTVGMIARSKTQVGDQLQFTRDEECVGQVSSN